MSYSTVNLLDRAKYVPRRGPLSLMKTHELACHVASRQHVSPGVKYARNRVHAVKSKEVARQRVSQFFDCWNFPGKMKVLTMPGLTWCFEKHLFTTRGQQTFRADSAGGFNTLWGKATRIYAIESDEAIFRASIGKIPGDQSPIQPGQDCIRTQFVRSYRRVEFSRVAYEPNLYDLAWLDFNGPITTLRLADIAAFWGKVNRAMVITWMNARHDKEATATISKIGPINRLLNSCSGAVYCWQMAYTTGHVPMLQLAIQRNLTALNPFEASR